VGQLEKSGVSSDGMVGECYMDIRGSMVLAPSYVDWALFIVDPWMSILLCIDRMLDLWGLVNRCSLMIVVVGWYPTIPLETSLGIVHELPTHRPACGIAWMMCTRERWDLDRPYSIVVKGCHTWLVRRRAYVMLVRLIPQQGWLLIWISMTLRNMSDNLFTAPTCRNACLLLWWLLRWLIDDDDYDDVFTLQYWLLSWMF
jgi:hypothetical protein